MIASCPTYSLNQITDLFLIHKFSSTRKYYREYLILSQEVWKEIFQQTLWVVKSEYIELKAGASGEYNYVDIPNNMLRFLSLSVKDKCGNLKPLYYNGNLDVLIKPKKKNCGCSDCNCSGLCEAIGGLTATTKEVIINGTPYTQTTWIKVCPNGDIYEYSTIPTLKYTFDPGAYDISYDISYEIGDSSSEVVYYNISRKLCNLEVKPCGCPVQCERNEQLFFSHCGCFLNSCNRVKKRCEKYWGECNFFAGEVKFSECGTKLFVKHVENFERNQWLVLSYQINGVEPDSQVQVPDYAKMCMFAGIEYHRSIFNDKYSLNEKQEKKYHYEDEKQKLILYNNLLDFTWAEQVGDQMARW